MLLANITVGGGKDGSRDKTRRDRLEEFMFDDAIALACEARGARLRAADNWRRGMRGASRIEWPSGTFADAARGDQVDAFQFNHSQGNANGGNGGSGEAGGGGNKSKGRAAWVWLCDLHPLAFLRRDADDSSPLPRGTPATAGRSTLEGAAENLSLQKQLLTLEGTINQLKDGLSTPRASGKASHDKGNAAAAAAKDGIVGDTDGGGADQGDTDEEGRDGGLRSFLQELAATVEGGKRAQVKALRTSIRNADQGQGAVDMRDTALREFEYYITSSGSRSWKWLTPLQRETLLEDLLDAVKAHL